MSVYLNEGSVLLDAGRVATSEDCCCGDCTIPCLQTHVVGEVSFSGTYEWPAFGITAIMVASGTLDDDLIDFGLFRGFQSSSFGTAHVTNNLGCDDTTGFEIEVYVRCFENAFQLHLFVAIPLCSTTENAAFVYGSGFEDFTPPITGVTFPMTDTTTLPYICTGTCTGEMTLTLTDPC